MISRLEENNPIVLDAYVTFTVETPLLSERQRHELNPLVIKIYSATCLPNTPVPIEVLQVTYTTISFWRNSFVILYYPQVSLLQIWT